jgi:16S rRNA G966 N2-methylase RsmD
MLYIANSIINTSTAQSDFPQLLVWSAQLVDNAPEVQTHRSGKRLRQGMFHMAQLESASVLEAVRLVEVVAGSSMTGREAPSADTER